jgi:tetratricopeptide (TPR) repeat protein
MLVTPLAEVAAPKTSELESNTTGMSEATRADIVQRLSSQELTAPNSISTEKTHFEPAGFSAHAVRHGRALYKAGRYEDAITLLSAAKDQAGAHFWIACSLEKLDRVDEAIAAYDLVIKNVTDAKDAQHAERNRDFLIWKRNFDARISVTTASSTPGESL